MINDRLIDLINFQGVSERKKFTDFSALTGINRETLKALYHKKQRINQDHIEAICKAYPQYKYWFVFGETDPEQGQISPELDDVMQAYNR